VAEVAGYVWETNLDDFVQLVAAYVDYRWDGLDDDALVGALDVTDAEKPKFPDLLIEQHAAQQRERIGLQQRVDRRILD
jgi:hypothetical protein